MSAGTGEPPQNHVQGGKKGGLGVSRLVPEAPVQCSRLLTLQTPKRLLPRHQRATGRGERAQDRGRHVGSADSQNLPLPETQLPDPRSRPWPPGAPGTGPSPLSQLHRLLPNLFLSSGTGFAGRGFALGQPDFPLLHPPALGCR